MWYLRRKASDTFIHYIRAAAASMHANTVLSHRIIYRSFDIHQFTDKEAVQKERARLTDELNRGYFLDISELRKHGGKVGLANETLIPVAAAKKFPSLLVEFNDGRTCFLPKESKEESAHPHATLICLSFRANSQAMIESWTSPFLEAFHPRNDLELFEVSLIDSWVLSLNLVKRLLLRTMRKSESVSSSVALQKNIVYLFGDHYELRKQLEILNLLTGYIFLVDSAGRIRWKASGIASKPELESLFSCTTSLLQEEA